MRIITLNTWGGRALHPLLTFFRRHHEDADIFCLQEVYDAEQAVLDFRHPREHVHGDLLRKIARELPGFSHSFARFYDDWHRMSLAMFVRDGVHRSPIKHQVIHRPVEVQEDGSAVRTARQLQYAEIGFGVSRVLVLNYHGLWTPDGKRDTPERVAQSHSLQEFMASFRGPRIICGDFNLDPDTESVAILGRGMRNLIHEAGVVSTRTPLYREFENPDGSKFADYIFVSPEVTIREFRVMHDLASDHAPLYLDYDFQWRG